MYKLIILYSDGTLCSLDFFDDFERYWNLVLHFFTDLDYKKIKTMYRFISVEYGIDDRPSSITFQFNTKH